MLAGAAAGVIMACFAEVASQFTQAGGPYLFGHFTVADAMYVPVVTRFRTYAAHVDSMCHNYMEAILEDPDFAAWEAQAELDPPPEPLPV